MIDRHVQFSVDHRREQRQGRPQHRGEPGRDLGFAGVDEPVREREHRKAGDADEAPVPAKGRRRQTAREAARRQELLEMPHDELGRLIQTLEEEMHEAAAELRFEYAARLRDEISDLKRELREAG